MNDIYINLDQLKNIHHALTDITEEFANATSSSEELEAAIGTPYGHSRLRSKAADFEERWDLKRKQLAGDLEKVAEHVQGVIDTVQQWDADTAIQLTPEN